MTHDKALPTEDSRLNEKAVAHYLRHNLDFFERHPNILASLKLPHESGQAVSLVERQVSLLRERNMDSRHTLSSLLDNARANDQIFEKTKRLTLALLDCIEFGDIVDALYYSFDKEFGVPFSRLVIISGHAATSSATAVKFVTREQAFKVMAERLACSRPVIGDISDEEMRFLFDQDSEHIGSAAFAVLHHNDAFGLLAIGHPEPDRYRANMGSLFLSYIAEVLDRLLPPYLNIGTRLPRRGHSS